MKAMQELYVAHDRRAAKKTLDEQNSDLAKFHQFARFSDIATSPTAKQNSKNDGRARD